MSKQPNPGRIDVRAQDAGTSDAESTEPPIQPISAAPAVPQARNDETASRAQAAAPEPTPDDPPIESVAAVESGFAVAGSDAWPIEFVLRPQTLPSHTWRGAITSSLFVPDNSMRWAFERPFGRSVIAGLNATFGVTSRLQLWATAPRVLCFGLDDFGTATSCSSFNRYIGTGGGLDYGVVRSRRFQLALGGSLTLALSSPQVFNAAIEVDTKWLVAARLALAVDVWARKWLDAPAFYVSEQAGATGLSLYLYLQVTRHWLFNAGTSPNGPIGHLDTPRIGGSVGTSWTFDNGVEVSAYAGAYNLADRRGWDQTVPGDTYGLSLRSWL